MELAVDSNEDKKLVTLLEKLVAERKTGEPIEVVVRPLEVADFVIEEQGIYVERKKLYSDFINSMRSGHLQSQALSMSELPRPFVIISGHINRVEAVKSKCMGYKVEHHIGALASLNTNYGNVRCFEVANDTQLLKAILSISGNVAKGAKVGVIERFGKTINRQNASVNAFVNLRGVGANKAIALNEIMTYREFVRFCEGSITHAKEEIGRRGGKPSWLNKTTCDYLIELGFDLK